MSIWGSRQLSRSQEVPYLSNGMAPRLDMHTLPVDGRVNNEELQALPRDTRQLEIRRRDVGPQFYASGASFVPAGSHTPNHKPRDFSHRGMSTAHHFKTPIGTIALTNPEDRNLGTMPSIETFDFLKHECQGSRFNPRPPRFFP